MVKVKQTRSITHNFVFLSIDNTNERMSAPPCNNLLPTCMLDSLEFSILVCEFSQHRFVHISTTNITHSVFVRRINRGCIQSSVWNQSLHQSTIIINSPEFFNNNLLLYRYKNRGTIAIPFSVVGYPSSIC